MSSISRSELRELMETRDGPCVSIYLPTHRAGPEIQQNPIRLKNLLVAAEERLLAAGLRRPEVERMLAPAQRLPAEGVFRQNPGDGLAIFIAPDFFRALPLPLAFEELVVVTERFHLTPLLPLLVDNGRFYVLALSQNDVRLLRCTRYTCQEVELRGVPRSIGEVIRSDKLQKNLERWAGRARRGRMRTAIWYGQGEKNMARDLLLYCQRIDRGVRQFLRSEQAPLVLAGVEPLLASYRQANTYPHLVGEQIEGSSDQLGAETLHERAWPVVQPLFARPQAEAAARFRARLGTGLASTDLKEILRAADAGRIESLFVATDRHAWGAFDPETREIALHPEPQPGDEDLLDRAAIQTLSLGGDVYAVDAEAVPDGYPIVAIYQQGGV